MYIYIYRAICMYIIFSISILFANFAYLYCYQYRSVFVAIFFVGKVRELPFHPIFTRAYIVGIYARINI